ncbi:PREDICTED: double-stranded [Prunus dulcis]|uniref:PREDICTED: double-stranded n=2 Tax=Prunus dulcis TaxID=3755 RepID=A0A5E4FHY6_PRUDU|nr:PREDICTED: double-stranded [Prunus dulcis]
MRPAAYKSRTRRLPRSQCRRTTESGDIMYKNQLQELAQRSCFNLPSYACIRQGPDHAPRFKASVNFNGEIFEGPNYCTTLRQAEHAAAEVALNKLSTRGPSRSLTARVLDETGIYKNLLQETAHRAGLKLPVYTTVRSGPGHVPVFTCTVELAGMSFTGEAAKTKKQAEKNAAIAAWSALKRSLGPLTAKEAEEQDQAVVTGVLSNFRPKDDHNSKQFIRRRDQIQARRRMVRGQCHRDNTIASASSLSSTSSAANSLQNQHWRLIDLLTDLVPEVSKQKQNSFASQLPPPPPRTASKILPPTTLLNKDNSSSYTLSNSNYRPIPVLQVNVRRGSQVIPPPLEDHQRDEEEWLGTGKSDIIISNNKAIEKEGPSNSNSSSAYRQFPVSNTGRQFPLGPVKALPTSSHMKDRAMYTGGFSPHRIAPAVQIRSVIPVCAAPPAPQSNPSRMMSMKDTSQAALSASSSSTNSGPMQPGTEVPSSASSKFNMPESSSTQLGSEFNKLQLGGGKE